MNKKCGKCTKTVYPTEELKCLDKVWHKACFKCQVCGMTLNMKNYKGYDKFPYCNAHYPTTKHTAVADTPESRRIAQNTKIQSNIKYHEQFEKDKGAKISVADDPETERLKKNMQVVSNVAYHNTLKSRQEQEQNRPMEATDNMAARNRRNPGSITDYNPPVEASPAASRSQPTPVYNSRGEEEAEVFDDKYNQPARKQIGSIADYDPMMGKGSPASVSQPVYQKQQPRSPALFSPTPYSPPGQFSSKQRQIGSVTYDPRSNAPSQAPGYQYNQSQSPGYQYNQSQSRPGQPMYQPYRPQEPPEEQPETGQFMTTYPVPSNADVPQDHGRYTNDYPVEPQDVPRDDGRYTNDYPVQTQEEPPVDDGFRTSYPTHPTPPSPSPEDEPVVGNGFRTSYPTEPAPAPQPQKQSRGMVSQALYDYQAADDDEVGFMENDIICNCEPVDDGWMYGTVERTGQRGMLPSNYVQRI